MFLRKCQGFSAVSASGANGAYCCPPCRIRRGATRVVSRRKLLYAERLLVRLRLTHRRRCWSRLLIAAFLQSGRSGEPAEIDKPRYVLLGRATRVLLQPFQKRIGLYHARPIPRHFVGQPCAQVPIAFHICERTQPEASAAPGWDAAIRHEDYVNIISGKPPSSPLCRTGNLLQLALVQDHIVRDDIYNPALDCNGIRV